MATDTKLPVVKNGGCDHSQGIPVDTFTEYVPHKVSMARGTNTTGSI